MILDDTYNASPESTLAALNLLEELDGRKVAVLGDMLELGPYEVEGHEKVGIRAAEVCSDLITLGDRGKIIANAAHTAGLSSAHIKPCDSTEEIIAYLKGHISAEDVILVKGSHGMRMDKIVTALEGDQ
jgi:UDP-N-acetylmuramoyl-tripeptide--D-alanyl-D-alanine ligase